MKQQDCLIRFLFEDLGVRGEWVRLQQSWQQAKQNQNLVNLNVESQLGQALAAVVLLSATIKFNGSMIMQIQGCGDLKALVAQSSNERKIRGLVRSEATVPGEYLKEMLGDGGRMVLTIESLDAEPYQGIVGVEENTLADVVKSYFTQSEQLETRLWLFADQNQAVGLFIQELPGDDKDKNDWQHIEILANTVTKQELFDLECEVLLHRLFNEEKIRVFQPEPVEFKCGCSRKKISGTLLALGRSELEAILVERDEIEVDCQFCGAKYQFDKVDIEHLLTSTLNEAEQISQTRH